MNAAAIEVVKQFTDIVIAYGQSDEYSFVLHEDCQLFERRAAKLATSISTAFSVEYCMQWGKFFEGQELERPFPTFDGRCVLYPKKSILRDYLSWRQADCEFSWRACKGDGLLIRDTGHVNNLYNTTFWNMVKGNPDTDTPAMTTTEAELALKASLSLSLLGCSLLTPDREHSQRTRTKSCSKDSTSTTIQKVRSGRRAVWYTER